MDYLLEHWQLIGAIIGVGIFFGSLKSDTRYMRKELDNHATNSRLGFEGVNKKLDSHSEILSEHGERLAHLEK